MTKLSDKQSGVIKGMAVGALVSAVSLASIIVWSPAALVPSGDVSKQLAFALKWDLLLALALMLSIGMLARHRFFTPEDIDGSGLSTGADQAIVYQSILQNTLEQVVLAVLTHLIWAATMPLSWQAAIPCAVALFLTGRILFAHGYTSGAPARALGFALTFYPTVLLLVIVVVKWITTLRGPW